MFSFSTCWTNRPGGKTDRLDAASFYAYKTALMLTAMYIWLYACAVVEGAGFADPLFVPRCILDFRERLFETLLQFGIIALSRRKI